MTARPPLSAAELEAMRARCEAATPGPWAHDTVQGQNAVIAGLQHVLNELERCRAIIDDLATEYAPFSGERCPWCERYPSSDNDWWEPRHHTDDCPFVRARSYLRAVRGE